MKGCDLRFTFFVCSLFVCLFAYDVFADREPKPLAANPQIKEIVYDSNAIHHYIGYYGYQSSMVFADGEVIDTISMGNSTGWQLNNLGNRLFLKPINENAETNVTIITNKRTYHFAFHAAEAKGIDDPDLSYEVRFRYPTVSTARSDYTTNAGNENVGYDVLYGENLNFNYKISGKDYIKPLKVFDDGRFMYMEFRDVNADLPAVFLVGDDGYEGLVNFHIRDNYVVVERVASRFTLRNGKDTACIFNQKMIDLENNPLERSRYKKKYNRRNN